MRSRERHFPYFPLVEPVQVKEELIPKEDLPTGYVTIDEAVAYFADHISRPHLAKQVRTKIIPAHKETRDTKTGRKPVWVVRPVDVREFLSSRFSRLKQ